MTGKQIARESVSGIGLFLLRFDERGNPVGGARTRSAFLEAAAGASNVLVMSHGWNNAYADARRLYRKLLTNVARHMAPNVATRTVALGVLWPSIVLLLPWERPPAIAARAGEIDWSRLEGLERGPSDRASAEKHLMSLMRGLRGVADDERRGLTRANVTGLLPTHVEPRRVRVRVPPGTLGPTMAGGSQVDPRWIARLGTMLQMKDRAGLIGRAGVAELLRQATAAAPGRLQLIGHSFGAKVVMSAAAAARVRFSSAVLLQPAVSRWAFADRLPQGGTGGFRSVLSLSSGPVVATRSKHDRELRWMFQLVARRGSDIGELPPVPPALAGGPVYGGLGGYEPSGIAAWRDARAATAPRGYPWARDPGLVSLESSSIIGNHGDVANVGTGWLIRKLLQV